MGDAKQLVEIERVFLAKAGMRPQSQVGQNFLNDVGLVNEGRDETVRKGSAVTWTGRRSRAQAHL